MTFAFFRTCLAGSQLEVSRVPVDKRQCYDTLASASMQTALFLLEFLEFKKGLPPHVPQQLHGLNLFRCSLFLPTFCCVESGLLLEANFR